MKRYILVFPIAALAASTAFGQSLLELQRDFITPQPQHKPTIIWQWMDGLVTKDGVTRDLEAFKEAGLAGVQNFQIGGPQQSQVGNPDMPIGGDRWKDMLRYTLDECERLGLTFGTHNCPGWTSSAHPAVEPKYSMQKLVFTETKATQKGDVVELPQPQVDTLWSYYEDVAVIAMPCDSVVEKRDVVNLTANFDSATGRLRLPDSVKAGMTILRIGQTTNGKTNEAQAPESGRGLECDKMSREAVLRFWNIYPQMVLDVAGRHAGKTFRNFEVDSYEAGGQTWSAVLPDEFQRRCGYDLLPFLPLMVERCKQIGTPEETRRFRNDWQNTVRQLFAENYYGYLAELVSRTPGMTLMIEPYGTGSQRPFQVIDIRRILAAAPGAEIATEFWTEPATWGWKDMVKHEAVMRNLQRPLLWAEAFTCWPLKAWQDDPQSLKAVCDRAFCMGVNRMMLHAGAANPWKNVEPGMSFGIWGTQFVPGQTWWKAGGAKELFGYMARCQSLLQRGVPAKEQLPAMRFFKTYHRVDETAGLDVYFLCNPTDNAVVDTLRLPDIDGRYTELWNPYTMEMNAIDLLTDTLLCIEPYGSRFVIATKERGSRLSQERRVVVDSMNVNGTWKISFPQRDGFVDMDTLLSWTESPEKDIKYFSGTATYYVDVQVDKRLLKRKDCRYVLSLGMVKNMAMVRVNGKQMPLLWKYPFECDVTDVLRKGQNSIEVEVTNLWPNRMIGDEQEPDDIEWHEPFGYDYAKGSPKVGSFMKSIPQWLSEGLPRPSKGRKTVSSFKFFNADSPLLPSGLLGPVKISAMQVVK